MVLAERMVATRPDGPRADTAWYRVGELRQKAGKLDAAIEAFARSQKAKPNGPRVPWALLATGWAHDTAGRPADAIKAWSELIDSYSTSEAMAEALQPEVMLDNEQVISRVDCSTPARRSNSRWKISQNLKHDFLNRFA